MSVDLVTISGLRHRRGSFTLDIPAWILLSGSVVGLVGPNGAGKTTLLRILAGFQRADSGSVSVLGLDPHAELAAVRQQLGFMSDDSAVFQAPIGRLLWMISGYYPTWDADLAEFLMKRFELDPRAPAHKLSRGEGSRLRLLLSMAFRPRLLILDEPAAGLDLAGRRALLRTVVEIAGEGDRSVIISSHLLTDLERIADRLLVLRRGSVVAEGPTDELVGEEASLEERMLAWEGAA